MQWKQLKQYNQQINCMNTNSKRGWLQQEDQLLHQFVASANSQKLRWVQVARVLHEKLGRLRTGKQCRQRWQHQLNPSIVRDEWTNMQQIQLFELQTQYGNKWAQIAQNLPGRTDNAVKNFFYSAVRKVFTKVNTYLGKQRNVKQFKSMRQFQTDFLSKLMAVVDGNYSKKIRLTNNEAIVHAKQILANVAVLSINHANNDQSEQAEHKLVEMIRIMHDFRKSCKKRKQRRMEFERQDIIESQQEPKSSKSINQISSQIESSNSTDRDSKKKFLSQNLIQFNDMKDEKNQKDDNLPQQMKIQNSKRISFEEINTSGSIGSLEINQSQDLFTKRQPKLFKFFSGMEERNNDKWWEVLETNIGVIKSFRMEEESLGDWEWGSDDVFSLVSQREDLLGSSQVFDSTQVLTKFKMLEASIALEDLLLNSKRSSRFEQYPQFL